MSTTSKTRTWQDNADELRRMDKAEGWPFARLVACSVEESKPGPKDRRRAHAELKASAREFAERWGTSTDRVLRYLRAWRKPAETQREANRQAIRDDYNKARPLRILRHPFRHDGE